MLVRWDHKVRKVSRADAAQQALPDRPAPTAQQARADPQVLRARSALPGRPVQLAQQDRAVTQAQLARPARKVQPA